MEFSLLAAYRFKFVEEMYQSVRLQLAKLARNGMKCTFIHETVRKDIPDIGMEEGS